MHCKQWGRGGPGWIHVSTLASHESKFSQVSDPDFQNCGFEVVHSVLNRQKSAAGAPPALAVDWGAETWPQQALLMATANS